MLGGLHHAASHSDEYNEVEEKKLGSGKRGEEAGRMSL
jgi:hypothetical protein